jgi:hypothetical protein
MPDASQQDGLAEGLSGAPNQNLFVPGPTRFVLPALFSVHLQKRSNAFIKTYQ